nr:alpha/beta hydrolase [Burkholderia ubonensis]
MRRRAGARSRPPKSKAQNIGSAAARGAPQSGFVFKPARAIMGACSKSVWPPRLVTVPGLHGSEGAHWQTWLERQFPRSLRVEQADWDAPDLAGWAQSVRTLLERERGPFVLAAHSFGCLAAAHALAQWPHAGEVAGVLLVAPASPRKFTFAGAFDARRLAVPSIVIGSETDPWMSPGDARTLAQRLGSAFVNLGDAGHINTAAGFGPWPRAKYFIDTLVHCAAPLRFRDEAREFDAAFAARVLAHAI